MTEAVCFVALLVTAGLACLITVVLHLAQGVRW